jgi:amidophosphoribosyltransferase
MCGIVGCISKKPFDIIEYLYRAEFMLQHRGEEGAGIAINIGDDSSEEWYVSRRVTPENEPSVASVDHLFGKITSDSSCIKFRKARMGVTQNRYSTAGSVRTLANQQPFVEDTKFGRLALVHNGNWPYSEKTKQELKKFGISFISNSDSEVILKLIAKSPKNNILDAIKEALLEVDGGFSIIIMTEHELIAVRDRYGTRPLCLGQFEDGYTVASEPVAFDALGKDFQTNFVREVEPGEIIIINRDGLFSDKLDVEVCEKKCVFELIYFSRPSSMIFGWGVSCFRRKLGNKDAKNFPFIVDKIVPVLDSGSWYGIGLGEGLGVPYEPALERTHYVGRSFIMPEDKKRNDTIRMKHNPIKDLFFQQRIGFSEDSIVRSHTSRQIISMVRNCQPKEMYMGVSSPPIKHPCRSGIDLKTYQELIAAYLSVDDIQSQVGLDGLHYLNLETLQEVAGPNYCYACLDGKYPF